MGLFKKDNPAEKKLKELTGGFILNSSFIETLKSRGLSIEDGVKIRTQLKREIKEGKVSEVNLEFRLNQLLSKHKDVPLTSLSKSEKECPNCGLIQASDYIYCIGCGHDLNEVHPDKSNDDVRRITFLHNYDFNLKTCPECNTKFLKADPFCFNCGTSVVSKGTLRNDSLEVRNGKLVEKKETNVDDELSSLEALYSQTVQSKYAATFKVAYVLYLEYFRKDPSKAFPDKTAKKYDTTVKDLKKQAIEDGFIEIGPAILEAKNVKVSDLKEILKEHGLKVSGKKDELIERLDENLSDDELERHFKSKNYQISSEGESFIENNRYILYITSNWDISNVFHPSDVGKIFEEKIYTDEEIYEKLLIHFRGVLDKKLSGEVWVDFKSYSNAVARIQEDAGELNDALNTRFKVFIFDINNFSLHSYRPEPAGTRLKKKDMTDLVSLMHKMTLPIDELKEAFDEAYNEVLFETAVTKSDSLVYLLKVFGGEDLDSISNEINQRYSNPR